MGADAVTHVRGVRLGGRRVGESPSQSSIRGELHARACLKLFLIPGTVSRHLTCISSFPPPYYPEIRTEDDIES